ncbi:MAG: hypothetical protein KGS72_17115 [Cyanobacteria bacterium REEB67]|nr:hypothetical protein [Cyanobacteria bacterium REEB67]
MFKKIKTPHRQPLWHLARMFGLFVLAAALTVSLQLGAESIVPASATRAVIAASRIEASLTAGAISLLLGILVTASVRRAFNLVQTGRWIQYAGFWFSSWIGLVLASHWFGAYELTVPALAGFSFFALAFGFATALGVVPWNGRTWLPMKKAVKKPDSK